MDQGDLAYYIRQYDISYCDKMQISSFHKQTKQDSQCSADGSLSSSIEFI
jgi:hypothetical protein